MLNIDAKTGEVIQQPNEEEWKKVREEDVGIFYAYFVDKPAETKRELAATYPNGGKEYREKVIRPEEGHFNVWKSGYEEFPYPIDVPDGISKDSPVPDIINMVYWERYTKEEIAQREREDAEATERAKAQAQLIESLPDTLASTDDAICMLYEMVLEGQNG